MSGHVACVAVERHAGDDVLFDYRPHWEAVDRRYAELAIEPVVVGPDEPNVLPGRQGGPRFAAMEVRAAGELRDLLVLREVFDGAALSAQDNDSFAAGPRLGLDAPSREFVGRSRALATGHTWAAAGAARQAPACRGRHRPRAGRIELIGGIRDTQ